MTPPRPHQLITIEVGDDPRAWDAGGFTVEGDRVMIGATTVRLVGEVGGRGIRSVLALGIDGPVDGLPFEPPASPASSERAPAAPDSDHPSPAHPNRVVAIDHLVALTPDMDRTTAALTACGVEARRTRRFEVDGSTRRQTFFWLGDTILELAGADHAGGTGEATFWGLALTCDDLDAAAVHLGEHLGRPKPAVQEDRRIATLRARELGISIPLALMSPHPAARESRSR